METDRQPAAFEPTRWSLVLEAKGDSRTASEQLVRLYWGPVYWAIRRGWNRTREDAKDLTQEFFLRFLEAGAAAGYDRDKGRFRTFLYGALKHFLLQERRDGARLKRGGGALPFSLDDLRDSGNEPAGGPERVFHQEWVRTILAEATARMRDESGSELAFRAFAAYHSTEGSTYESVAAALGIGVNDVHYHLKSMRRRLKEIVRGIVRETLSDPKDLDEEVGLLFP